MSLTVNVACIDEEVAQGVEIWPLSEHIYIRGRDSNDRFVGDRIVGDRFVSDRFVVDRFNAD